MIQLPEDITKDFWDRVKVLLKSNKKTQLELCNATGINLGTLKGQMTKNNSPSIDEIFLIANYLNVSIDFLITGKEKELPHHQVDVEQLKSALQTCLNLLE